MSEWSASNRAEDDLLDIHVYGVENFGRWKAIEYIHELDRVFDLIARNRRMGRLAHKIAPSVGRHVILYEERASGVSILAIIHASAIRRLGL